MIALAWPAEKLLFISSQRSLTDRYCQLLPALRAAAQVTVNGEIKPPQAKKGGEILIRGAGVSPGYWDPSVDAPGTAGHGRASNGMAAKNASDFIPDPTDEVLIL